MVAVYKGCPFCERVFDVSESPTALKLHIGVEHADSDDERGQSDDGDRTRRDDGVRTSPAP